MKKAMVTICCSLVFTFGSFAQVKEREDSGQKEMQESKKDKGPLEEDAKDAGPNKMKEQKNLSVKNYVIRVYGKVQDVTYRNSAKQKATELGLQGTARNENDGSVYIEVEGSDEAQIRKFIEWCKKGPDEAKVKKVDVKPGIVKNYKEFDVDRVSKK